MPWKLLLYYILLMHSFNQICRGFFHRMEWDRSELLLLVITGLWERHHVLLRHESVYSKLINVSLVSRCQGARAKQCILIPAVHNEVCQGPTRLQGHAWDMTWLASCGGRKDLLQKTLFSMSYLVFIKGVHSLAWLSVKSDTSLKSYFKKWLGKPSALIKSDNHPP